MADFDLDDPLGDLLSDGSNDGFFEDTKTLGEKLSLTKAPEKKIVSELFKIDQPEPKQTNTKVNWLGLDVDSKKSIVPDKMHSSPKKFVKKWLEDDNINNLGLKQDSRNEKLDGSKTMIESTLKPAIAKEKNVTFDNILKASKVTKKVETDSHTVASVPQPQDSLSNYRSSSLDVPREGRHSYQPQSAFTDFLGLFPVDPTKVTEVDLKKSIPGTPTKKSGTTNLSYNVKHNSSISDTEVMQTEVLFPAPGNREMKTKSAPNIGIVPNWLNGDFSTKIQKPHSVLPYQEDDQITNSQATHSKNVAPQHQTLGLNNRNTDDNNMVNSLLTQQKLATSDIECQNAAFAMQQQDGQLLMALHLKKYEESLVNMQLNQQELLSKQEQQFNCLLERQLAKQEIMETNMRLQQERINSHMQMLISQSSVNSGCVLEDVDKFQIHKKSNMNENAQLYEELINSLKQKSQEEKFVLEESYKKQITTLEQTMESVENRLKVEMNYLLERHREKCEQLKQDYEEEIKKYKEKIEDMSVRHINEIKSIREHHDRIVEEIKYEYSTLIESIKQAKQSENALFQNSSDYSKKLEANLDMLNMNTKILVGVRERVDTDYGILTIAREESLKTKEEEVELMKESLEKLRISTDNERSQLLALVRTLETKLAEQNQNAREERWAMQQAAATLTARSSALNREAEFNRASLEREREQLKSLKESLLAEQEHKTLHLTEEKLALSAEKARLETSAILWQNYDAQKAKTEIDAAIEVAKKATELTDTERQKLHRLQYEVETLKRNLTDREHKLSMREKEIDSLMQIAEQKSKDGEQALTQAKATQRDYNERLKDIQNQLVSLSSREKRLAEEKIFLSKERLALQEQMRQLRRYSLYEIDVVPRIQEYDCPESV